MHGNVASKVFFQRVLRIVLLAGLATLFSAAPSFALQPGAINDNDTVVLSGNVYPLARAEFDVGRTNPSLQMDRIILSLRLSPRKQAELDSLLSEQQDPASPNFHHWLTPQEFGELFGPTPGQIEGVTAWLTAHGFVIDEVANGRMWINFSGSVANVERAFHTEIHDYSVGGKRYHANAQNPSIPRALSDAVVGVVSLNDFPIPMLHDEIQVQPDYTSGSNHYMSPGDFSIIYNLNPLYSSGIDGSGQSIAIVGRTNPSTAATDWANFRSKMGLPVSNPQIIINGPDPGDLGINEDSEADLDVEWSGAVAKNASILFVTSKSTASTDGVSLSAQYIVDNNLAPVMSTSFGLCETSLTTTGNSFYNNLWQQAASQGITSFVSSGDSGAAGCSSPSSTTGAGRAVNGLASTPYNVAVGGSQFNEGSGTYWNTTNTTGYTSAISYIPEIVWNESGNVSGDTGLWATGGGVSTLYSKPAWQVSPGVPSDNARDVPDVALSAAGHDGYLTMIQGSLYIVSGTSASSPSFAGIMALVVQKTNDNQGNANTRLYELGNAQFAGGGAAVFHDIISGNNSVPGVTGYSAASGYDLATGLGSVDAYALVNSWEIIGACGPANGASFSSAPSTGLCSVGTPSTLTGTGPWSWSCAGSYGGSTASCSANLEIDGACGAANGASFYSEPTTNLCGVGTASAVTGTGPWSWSCAGSYGGSTASCFANLEVDGACGAANGASFSAIPASGLCSGGTPSTVTGTGPWNWSCNGINGGITATCSATYGLTGLLTIEGTTTYYGSMYDAYNAAAGGNTIESQAVILTENPVFNSPVSVIIQGGYDSTFSSIIGYTIISGTMAIQDGTVTVNDLIVQ
jgi:pseudomonalisin